MIVWFVSNNMVDALSEEDGIKLRPSQQLAKLISALMWVNRTEEA